MIEPSKTKKNGYCVIAGDNFAQGSKEECGFSAKYLGQSLLSPNLTLASVGELD
jgi:hypothetical protein